MVQSPTQTWVPKSRMMGPAAMVSTGMSGRAAGALARSGTRWLPRLLLRFCNYIIFKTFWELLNLSCLSRLPALWTLDLLWLHIA